MSDSQPWASTHYVFLLALVFLVNAPIELVAIAAILLAIGGGDTQRANCSLHAYAHMLSQ